MSGNMMPWLILAAVVVATLAYKGYLKMPASHSASRPPTPVNPPMAGVTYQSATPAEAHILERLDSHTLGVYFALAKRREVEAGLAHKIADDAGKDIEATFTAPFSKPAPTGQDPNQAGVKPAIS